MAKILNHREHEISINTPKASVTIPRSAPDPADKNKMVPGSAEVDDAHLAEARKSPVVQHYFREGWLRQDKADKGKPKQEE